MRLSTLRRLAALRAATVALSSCAVAQRIDSAIDGNACLSERSCVQAPFACVSGCASVVP